MTPVNGTGIKRVALINDLSCFGKCSLTVSVPVISSYGIETVPLPTAVLSTHTGGFEGYCIEDMTKAMENFAAHWKAIGLRFDCIYTGFICSVEQLEFTRRFIDEFADEDTLVIVDPVMGDNGALYPIFDMAFAEAMRLLVQKAHIITPNRTEARLLTGLDAHCTDGELLAALEAPNAVITSIEGERSIGYLARMDNRTLRLAFPRLDMTLHGAGDVFTSALCAELMCGKAPASALRSAALFCHECIEETAKHRPYHWYGLAFEEVIKRRRQ